MHTTTLLVMILALVSVYDRSDWTHWSDLDGDCQDTRQEVLIEDGLDVQLTSNGCRVESGMWVDLYTGKVVRDPALLDIDHVVPLKHAWEAGGWAWSDDRRKAYANDQRYLIATHRTQNRRKGAKGPHEWMPPHEDAKCWYVELWLLAKEEYDLKLSLEEARWVLLESGCP